MTQKFVVAKTLLSALPRMDEYIAHMTRKIDFTATSSALSTMSAEAVVDRILKNMVRKDKIVDVRKRVVDACCDLLKQHCVDGLTVVDIAKKQGQSERTVFRHLAEAQEKFAEKLELIGINSFTLNDLLRKYRWLGSEYQSACARERTEHKK